MSSITNATARPVSTIWNASGWPLAEMMFMPRFLRGVDLGDLLDVGGAGGRDDGLALQVVERT